MSVHEDTLTGLQQALDYVKGDKSQGRAITLTIPNNDIGLKFERLSKEGQNAIMTIIDKMLIADGQ